jgi:TRAP-type transport system periplasmic protein
VQGVFAQKFKEEVEANSDHEVQLFPFGTLGEIADIMEQAQAGILQFVNQSPGFTGALIPEAQVFFVPYLLPQDTGAARSSSSAPPWRSTRCSPSSMPSRGWSF